MPNVTNTLFANITSTEDSTQNVPINRGTGNPAFDSTYGQMTEYMQLTAAIANNIPLPGPTAYQLYVKNNDPTNAVNVSLKTVLSGVLFQLCSLMPGDEFILWQKPGGTNAGFTQLQLTPVAGTPIVEYFIGG